MLTQLSLAGRADGVIHWTTKEIITFDHMRQERVKRLKNPTEQID